MPIGGAGVGSRNSLAQYLGSESARHTKRLGESFPAHSVFRWRGPASDA